MGTKKFKPPSARKAEKKASGMSQTIQNMLQSVRAKPLCAPCPACSTDRPCPLGKQRVGIAVTTAAALYAAYVYNSPLHYLETTSENLKEVGAQKVSFTFAPCHSQSTACVCAGLLWPRAVACYLQQRFGCGWRV